MGKNAQVAPIKYYSILDPNGLKTCIVAGADKDEDGKKLGSLLACFPEDTKDRSCDLGDTFVIRDHEKSLCEKLPTGDWDCPPAGKQCKWMADKWNCADNWECMWHEEQWKCPPKPGMTKEKNW